MMMMMSFEAKDFGDEITKFAANGILAAVPLNVSGNFLGILHHVPVPREQSINQ